MRTTLLLAALASAASLAAGCASSPQQSTSANVTPNAPCPGGGTLGGSTLGNSTGPGDANATNASNATQTPSCRGNADSQASATSPSHAPDAGATTSSGSGPSG